MNLRSGLVFFADRFFQPTATLLGRVSHARSAGAAASARAIVVGHRGQPLGVFTLGLGRNAGLEPRREFGF